MASPKIELRPHIGREQRRVGGGFVMSEVDFKQCLVFADGKQVAIYCGRKDEPGRFLSFIEPFPENIQKMIADDVAKITGGVGSHAAPPPEEHDVE